MNEIGLKQCIDAQNRWQRASWYRAITLQERLSLPRTGGKDAVSISSSEQASKRLQRWKELGPFQKDGYFERRLKMDDCTEENLLALLAESAEVVQANVASVPAWLEKLRRAFEEQSAPAHTLKVSGDNSAAFLETIRPLINAGLRRFQQRIEELAQENTQLPFEPETVLELFVSHLSPRLLSKMLRTFVLELNVARVQGKLQGETPEERFKHFMHRLQRDGEILDLLEEYAVLARKLVEVVDGWVDSSLELLERMTADWEEISCLFAHGEHPGVLTEVQASKGDTHKGGRSVTILHWSSGLRLVYKPRALGIEVHFQEVLTWLNGLGYQPAFRTYAILDRGSYGWVEFLQAGPCASQEEVDRFYQRQGGYLALLYAMEGRDFHAENLIAMGEYPMLIDLEALFRPSISVQEVFQQGYPGIETIGHSVLNISLLPQRIWAGEQGGGIDVSGLGGQAGQMVPTSVASWTGVGTDQMRLNLEHIELAMGQHRPMLNDQDVDTLEFRESVVTGFTNAYRMLLRHRETLLYDMLPRFTHDETRCVLRPTQAYNILMHDSFHPNLLREALDRDCFLDRLWIGVEHQASLARLIPSEHADLLDGDIPIFYSYPDTLDLISSRGDRIVGYFDESGMEVARKNIQRFDENDLEKQVWIIRASFTSMALGLSDVMKSMLKLCPSETPVTRERLIRAAQAVGDQLSKLALYREQTVGWLGVTPVQDREWHLLPTGYDLYSGLSGIALFLGYLGLLTGDGRYAALAKMALNTMRNQMEHKKQMMEEGSISAFNGLGSYIYLLAHLGTIWDDPDLYQEAEEIVKTLPDLITQDEMYDVLGGSAGTIAALLTLYEVEPSYITLATAIHCGDHLLAHAQTMEHGIGWIMKGEDVPLAGYAHGNAGIVLSLLRLAAVSGEDRFREAALQAMEYERSLYSPEKLNWPDLRKDRTKKMDSKQPIPREQWFYMVAWCHGAAGIGLARLASLQYVDDATIRDEIDAALQTTLTSGFGRNHSLCHGDMGNIDTILTAAEVFDDAIYRGEAERIAAMLLDSIDTHGWVSGIPQGVETPGLMTGLAGIGYELLRLAAPERVPSVLHLAPPLR